MSSLFLSKPTEKQSTTDFQKNLKSKTYQVMVKAIVTNEAHFVKEW